MPNELLGTLGKELVLTNLSQSVEIYSNDLWNKACEHWVKIQFRDKETENFLRYYVSGADYYHVPSTRKLILDSELVDSTGVKNHLILLSVGNRARLVNAELWQLFRKNPNSENVRHFLEEQRLIFASPKNINREEKAEKLERFLHDNSKVIRQSSDFRSFELAVGETLDASGIGIIEVTPFAKDGGTDLIVYIPGENGNEIFYVQCKAGRKKTSVKDLRELIGVIARDGVNAGLLISTAGFTSGTIKEAAISKIHVELVKAKKLANWVESKLSS